MAFAKPEEAGFVPARRQRAYDLLGPRTFGHGGRRYRAKAEDLLKQIRAGAKFEDIAKKESQGPSAAQGGDLGPFERGKLAKQLEDLTFAMKKGEVSDVIPTKQGFVILKVTDHQAAGIPPMSEMESRLQEAESVPQCERLGPQARTIWPPPPIATANGSCGPARRRLKRKAAMDWT